MQEGDISQTEDISKHSKTAKNAPEEGDGDVVVDMQEGDLPHVALDDHDDLHGAHHCLRLDHVHIQKRSDDWVHLPSCTA